MASRVIMEKKAKPFTTFFFYIPKKISVCGDVKFQKVWKEAPITSEKLWKNIKKDLSPEEFEDLINGYEYKRRIKEEYELLTKIILDKLAEKGLNFPTFQEYLRFISEREYEKRSSKRDDKSEP